MSTARVRSGRATQENRKYGKCTCVSRGSYGGSYLRCHWLATGADKLCDGCRKRCGYLKGNHINEDYPT